MIIIKIIYDISGNTQIDPREPNSLLKIFIRMKSQKKGRPLRVALFIRSKN